MKDDSVVVKKPSEEIIEEWFARNFQHWSGYETSLYNHAHSAKEELKKVFFNRDRQNDEPNKED